MMNERIRELAKEAGAHISTRNLMSNPPQHVETVELWDDRIEKFAELIVKETMQVVANQLPSNVYLDVADAVIKHFESK
jgi:hypothetical protein